MKLFFVSLVLFIILDVLWLGVIARSFFSAHLGPMMRMNDDGTTQIVYWAAAVVYVLLAAGIVLFVLPKFSPNDPWLSAFIWGGIFGAITYGVFDFTSYSIFKDFPAIVIIADVLWGAVSCGIVTVTTKLLSDHMFIP